MTALLQSWKDPIWTMRPNTWTYIKAHNDGNLAEGSLLLGLPVETSFGSPQQITLVDLPAILVTDRDQIDVQLSDQATLEMETAPAVGEQSPPSDQSVLKSMFNTMTSRSKSLARLRGS